MLGLCVCKRGVHVAPGQGKKAQVSKFARVRLEQEP